MTDWLTKKTEAEREWFRKEHEKQFGKPTQPQSERDKELQKVVAKIQKLSRKKVCERKHFSPKIDLPPPLVQIEWDAPLALKCACPTGDCSCTCKGNTLLPKKILPIIPRYDWWGIRPVLCKLHIVKQPKPAGDLARSFAESVKKESQFYKSAEGSAILEERGPEFCLSGCLKFFITNKKIVKDYTKIIKQMKTDMAVKMPTIATEDDVAAKKTSMERICDQFRCTVSTQSRIGEDGEFIIGHYSHLLFGFPDENFLCDIEGAELHVASYKAEPHEDPGMFLQVVKTADRLLHVSDFKQRISQVKKDFITSVFEIEEKHLSKASQYECKDLAIKVPQGVCESLADVRRKRREKECREKMQRSNKFVENQLTDKPELETSDSSENRMVHSIDSSVIPYDENYTCPPCNDHTHLGKEKDKIKTGVVDQLKADILQSIKDIRDKIVLANSFVDPNEISENENIKIKEFIKRLDRIIDNISEKIDKIEKDYVFDDKQTQFQTFDDKVKMNVSKIMEPRKRLVQETISNLTKSVEMVILHPEVSFNKHVFSEMKVNLSSVEKIKQMESQSKHSTIPHKTQPTYKDSTCQPCDKLMKIAKFINETVSGTTENLDTRNSPILKHIKDKPTNENIPAKLPERPKIVQQPKENADGEGIGSTNIIEKDKTLKIAEINNVLDTETNMSESQMKIPSIDAAVSTEKKERISKIDKAREFPNEPAKVKLPIEKPNDEKVSLESSKVNQQVPKIDEGKNILYEENKLVSQDQNLSAENSLSKLKENLSETVEIKKMSNTHTQNKDDSEIQKSSIEDTPTPLSSVKEKLLHTGPIKKVLDKYINNPSQIETPSTEGSPIFIEKKGEVSKIDEVKEIIETEDKLSDAHAKVDSQSQKQTTKDTSPKLSESKKENATIVLTKKISDTEIIVNSRIQKSSIEDPSQKILGLKRESSKINLVKQRLDAETKASSLVKTSSIEAPRELTEASKTIEIKNVSDTEMTIDSRVQKSSDADTPSKLSLKESKNGQQKQPPSIKTKVSSESNKANVVEPPFTNVNEAKTNEVKTGFDKDAIIDSRIGQLGIEDESRMSFKEKQEVSKTNPINNVSNEKIKFVPEIHKPSTKAPPVITKIKEELPKLDEIKKMSGTNTKDDRQMKTPIAMSELSDDKDNILDSKSMEVAKIHKVGMESPLGLKEELSPKVNKSTDKATETKVDSQIQKPDIGDFIPEVKDKSAGTTENVRGDVTDIEAKDANKAMKVKRNKQFLGKESSTVGKHEDSQLSFESNVTKGIASTSQSQVESLSEGSERGSARVFIPCPIKKLIQMKDSMKSFLSSDEVPKFCKDGSCQPCKKLKQFGRAVDKAFQDLKSNKRIDRKGPHLRASFFLNENIEGSVLIEVPKTLSDRIHLKCENQKDSEKLSSRGSFNAKKLVDFVKSQSTTNENIINDNINVSKLSAATKFGVPLCDKSKLKETNNVLDTYLNENNREYNPDSTIKHDKMNGNYQSTSKVTNKENNNSQNIRDQNKKRRKFEGYKTYLSRVSRILAFKKKTHLKVFIKRNLITMGKNCKVVMRGGKKSRGLMTPIDDVISKFHIQDIQTTAVDIATKNSAHAKIDTSDINDHPLSCKIKTKDDDNKFKPCKSNKKDRSKLKVEDPVETDKTCDNNLGAYVALHKKIDKNKQSIRKLCHKLSQLSWNSLVSHSSVWPTRQMNKVFRKYYNNSKSINDATKNGGIQFKEEDASTRENEACDKITVKPSYESPYKFMYSSHKLVSDCKRLFAKYVKQFKTEVTSEAQTKNPNKNYRFYY